MCHVKLTVKFDTSIQFLTLVTRFTNPENKAKRGIREPRKCRKIKSIKKLYSVVVLYAVSELIKTTFLRQ